MDGNTRFKCDYVYKQLEYDILHNVIKPNELLNEKDLCTRFQVSRTPIRQAQNELVKNGFAYHVPNKGLFVTKIELIDALEIYRIREALDPIAIEVSMMEEGQDTLRRMQTALVNQQKFIQAGQYYEYLDADMEFHSAYLCRYHFKRLRGILEQLISASSRFSRFATDDFERAKMSIAQHEIICNAYACHDVETAKRAVERHMVEVREYFKKKL